jgi:hypothetical protein
MFLPKTHRIFASSPRGANFSFKCQIVNDKNYPMKLSLLLQPLLASFRYIYPSTRQFQIVSLLPVYSRVKI